MRFLKSKTFKGLLCLVLFIFVVSAIVYFIDFVASKNAKDESTFFEQMNGESVLLMPSGVVFDCLQKEYSKDLERVYKFSCDLNFEYIERDSKTKNINTVPCGQMKKIDLSEYEGLFWISENPQLTSFDFSYKDFLRNNKNAWAILTNEELPSDIAGERPTRFYLLFEQKDGSLLIGVAIGYFGADESDWFRNYCIALLETEIVTEEEIESEDTNLYYKENRVIDKYLFDFDSDGEKEEVTILYGGIDENKECSTFIFVVNSKGVGALKVGNKYSTRYYDDWTYDERYFLEENGELYYCYKEENIAKCRITLDREKRKVIVEKHFEANDLIEEKTEVGTTVAPTSVFS